MMREPLAWIQQYSDALVAIGSLATVLVLALSQYLTLRKMGRQMQRQAAPFFEPLPRRWWQQGHLHRFKNCGATALNVHVSGMLFEKYSSTREHVDQIKLNEVFYLHNNTEVTTDTRTFEFVYADERGEQYRAQYRWNEDTRNYVLHGFGPR